MSLRWKTQIFTLVVWAGFTVSSVLVQQWVILPRFEVVEGVAARADLARCVNALLHEAQQLEQIAADYADGDGYRRLLEGESQSLEPLDTATDTFSNLNLDLVLFLDYEGRIASGELRQDCAVVERGPSILPFLALPCQPTELLDPAVVRTSGVLITPRGPMLLGAHVIGAKLGDNPPAGMVILGRYLSPLRVAELGERTHVSLEIEVLAAIGDRQRAAYSAAARTEEGQAIQRDASVVSGYGVVCDLFGRPALGLRTTQPRDIYRQGVLTARLGTVITLLAGVGILLTMWYLLSWLVVSPLHRLTQHAMHVGRSGDLRARLNLTSRDEIGALARELDRMVDQLAELQTNMVRVARSAGMADVAASVLHNVGNVLNSVNIAAGNVQAKLRNSETATLTQAAELLLAQQERLAEFLTQDERGRRLPAFLAELAGCLDREHESMRQDMAHLAGAVEHIRRIVRLQQDYGGAARSIECVDPAALLEKALALSAESFGRHGIKVTRRYERRAAVWLDQHRALQIIVNLISNARQAIKAARPSEPEIAVSIENAGPERFRICIEDNGIGIPAENLERIFSLGFTTKADGQGIGLHTSALMAREMSGTLTVRSAGRGRGAAFTLELPVDGRTSASAQELTTGVAAAAAQVEGANP